MALTEKQLARRRLSLGGSDIATLMGHDRRSEYDLWLAKKHGVDAFEGNDATEYGHVVEEGVAQWAARQLGVRIVRNQFRSRPDLPFHVNLDAKIVGRPEAIEVKSTGYMVDEEWLEPGTDEIPHRVVCQTQWQMLVPEGGLERIHVAAALSPTFGSNKLRMYLVEAYPELQERMIEIGKGWWTKYVIGEEVPLDLPSDEAIRAVERVANFEVPLDRDLVAEFKSAKADARLANGLVKDLKSEIQKALYCAERGQFAEVGVLPSGAKLTYFEHTRKPEKEPRKGGQYRRMVEPKEID